MSWCHEFINIFDPYLHSFPLTTSQALILGIKIPRTKPLDLLYGHFISIYSNLLEQELYIGIPSPDSRPLKDAHYYLPVHAPDCMDYLSIKIANAINNTYSPSKGGEEPI
jgi:hypothetical protein